LKLITESSVFGYTQNYLWALIFLKHATTAMVILNNGELLDNLIVGSSFLYGYISLLG